MANKLKMFAILMAINLSSFGCNISNASSSETAGSANNTVMTEASPAMQYDTIISSLTTESVASTFIVETSTTATISAMVVHLHKAQ